MPFNEGQFGKGAIDRPEDFFSKRAWRHEEIAGAFQPAIWTEKPIANGFITYPKRNQGAQNSCVGYTLAKQLSVDELSENGVYREMSPASIYAYTRVTGGGASSIIASKLATKIGLTLEHLLPTDGKDDLGAADATGYATDAKQVALVYKPGSIVESTADFETIASILHNFQQAGKKKVVTVTIIGQNNGTWLSSFPKPASNPTITPWYHRVCVTDFGLVGGRKHLAIDNSWGEIPGNKGQQLLSIDHQDYMYGGIYTLNQPDNWQQLSASSVPMPRYQWASDFGYGKTGNDVLVLQQALQSMGMFPVDKFVKPTGNFYGVTQKAVELFQAAMIVPVTGQVDFQTREKLNSIFNV